jgi:hypothetical protein
MRQTESKPRLSAGSPQLRLEVVVYAGESAEIAVLAEVALVIGQAKRGGRGHAAPFLTLLVNLAGVALRQARPRDADAEVAIEVVPAVGAYPIDAELPVALRIVRARLSEKEATGTGDGNQQTPDHQRDSSLSHIPS